MARVVVSGLPQWRQDLSTVREPERRQRMKGVWFFAVAACVGAPSQARPIGFDARANRSHVMTRAHMEAK